VRHEYRKAELSDIPTLSRLRGDGEAGGASEDRMARYLAGTHHPQEALQAREMWLVSVDGSAIGYVAGHLTRRFECDGELQWIYVAPEARGTPVAGELLRIMARWFVAQGAKRICVDVGDERARRFYRRHGAVEISQHWMTWDDIGTVLG
jgi:ribosomal protein S18 acetylase RimI-like enzyme